MAWKCPRTPKPCETGRHYGQRIASDCKRPRVGTASGSGVFAATTLRQAREHVEREMVEQALTKNSGKITSAAADLGISRPTLYELMEKLGIAKERVNTNVS